MSKDIRDFYQSYKLWLDSGAPEGVPYARGRGLCNALMLYCVFKDFEISKQEELRREFFDHLKKNALDIFFPFGGKAKFVSEMNDDSAYLNPQRIAFVNKMLGETI